MSFAVKLLQHIVKYKQNKRKASFPVELFYFFQKENLLGKINVKKKKTTSKKYRKDNEQKIILITIFASIVLSFLIMFHFQHSMRPLMEVKKLPTSALNAAHKTKITPSCTEDLPFCAFLVHSLYGSSQSIYDCSPFL